MKKWLGFFFLLFSQVALANSFINLDLEHVNVTDALQAFAKETGRNIIISANVNGTVSLHLKQVPEEEAFRMLLLSQGLASWRIGSVIFIAPRSELSLKQAEQEKQRTEQEANQSLTTQMFSIRFAKAKEVTQFLQEGNHALLSSRGQINVDERSQSK
jgi:type IV pilus assembly protein PilQ